MHPKLFKIFFGELECVGHSLAYIAQLYIFLRYVWIRTQRAAVASMRATNLSTHLRNFVIPTFCMCTSTFQTIVQLCRPVFFFIRSMQVLTCMSIYCEAKAKVCNLRFWRLSRRSSSIPSPSSALPAPAG
jgi:hypothetical protein